MVLDALRTALSGDGPAILPRPAAPAARPTGPSQQDPAQQDTVHPDPVHPDPVHPDPGLPDSVPQRVALAIETSGSTGRPKRVALSADALLSSAAASEAALGGPGQWLLALPVHYIAGINVLTRSLSAGTSPVVLPPGHFDARRFAEAIETMDADQRFTALVPAQLARLIDAAEEDAGVLDRIRRLDRILVGGQAAPAVLVERAAGLGLGISCTYGSSETSGGCVYDGVPLSGVGLRVRDDQIEVTGPTLAEGYLGDPERTAEAFLDEGGVRWYRTGDTGSIDDGVLRVIGRLDDVIVSGGEKVSLGMIEQCIRGLPGLGDAVVVATDDERWGQVPRVVATRPVELTPLRRAVTAALGRAAAPASIVVVERIPRLPSGKPDRQALGRLVAASLQS